MMCFFTIDAGLHAIVSRLDVLPTFVRSAYVSDLVLKGRVIVEVDQRDLLSDQCDDDATDFSTAKAANYKPSARETGNSG